MALYVDTAGNDANPCTASGAAACATVQGALSKVDRDVTHNVVVNVGSGNFGCFSVSGFRFNPQAQSQLSDGGAYTGGPVGGGASITVQGTMAQSSLASGSATGTVSSATAGSVSGLGLVLATMTDNAQSWAQNDLKGRYLIYTSGPRVFNRALVYANTATTLTLVSSSASVPTVGDSYRIEEPSTAINTACPRAPAAGLLKDGGYFTGTANLAAVQVSDNLGASVATVRLTQFDLVASSGYGILVRSLNGVAIDTVRARNVSNTTHRILVESSTDYTSISNVALRAANIASSSTYNIGTVYNPVNLGGYGLMVNTSLCEGGRSCISATVPSYIFTVVADPVSNFGLELRGNSLVLGYKCEGSDAGAFTACLRAGDSEHRGYCYGGLYLTALTLNSPVQPGVGVDINGKCVADVKGTTGFMDAGVGIRANFGAVVNIYDSISNLGGATADVQLQDSSSFGGASNTYYQLSNVRVFGPPTCTPAGIPYGTVLCAQP